MSGFRSILGGPLITLAVMCVATDPSVADGSIALDLQRLMSENGYIGTAVITFRSILGEMDPVSIDSLVGDFLNDGFVFDKENSSLTLEGVAAKNCVSHYSKMEPTLIFFHPDMNVNASIDTKEDCVVEKILVWISPSP